MKTPEQLAEEHADRVMRPREGNALRSWVALQDTFLAGYQAAKDQLADGGKVMPEWISVKERLPEEDKDVLIYVPSKDGDSAHWVRDYHLNGKWVIHGYEPTHWMPLPEAPKGEER